MRFMAIIAFCLIAMMAMVKDEQDHKPETKNIELVATQKHLTPGLINEASHKLEENTNKHENPIDPSRTQKRSVQEEPKLIEQRNEKPRIHSKAVSESTAQATKKNHTDEEIKSQFVKEPGPLTLRFESDEAFVNLIASRKVQLFAKMNSGFFAMDHNFRINSAKPSGELYEVMAESIPMKITKVFEHSGSASLYLVMLPDESIKELRHFLVSEKTPATGSLVIRQNGKLIYED